jgi:hypothetical protein
MDGANLKPVVEAVSIAPSVHSRPAVSKGNNGGAKSVDDPMRRFAPTPYCACLPVMGRTIRLETNSSRLLEHMVKLFARHTGEPSGNASFLWRIAVDPDVTFGQPWPPRSAFSDEGIRFAQFGQRNFIAVDLEAREAIAYVAQGLLDDELGFTSPFVDTLFYMTAGGLGLVAFGAACVSSATQGLLVLGSPNQGKTTASYLASQGGLTHHADQSVFLEIANGGLRAWADFVPIAFRRETFQFLPELESRTQRYSYCDFEFYYMNKGRPGSEDLGFVAPIASVVLERESSFMPKLERLASADFSCILPRHFAFKDDCRFEERRLAILAALAQLPAYHLAYDSDPKTAVPFLRELLIRHGRQRSDPSDERQRESGDASC